MSVILQPLDVVVVDGLWYMPHHWLIRWRGLDKAVHCLTVGVSPRRPLISPEFNGIQIRCLDDYKGRRITIHRYRGELPANRQRWLVDTVRSAKGYDFRQWVLGGLLGLIRRQWVDDSQQWTCAELPYWLFQENGAQITPADEVLPMPRLFRYNPMFETVFDGVWGG